ncbi:MAG: Cof-type HAD-IIB family hydrolase [Buchnera aphidicola (Nurudea yanoniella)]
MKVSMYYDIISIDLDGTLLFPNNSLSKYTKNVIRMLSKKGIYFVIATGRHYIEANNIKNVLKIPAFLITSNGARIHDPYGKLIYSCDLDESIVLRLVNLYLCKSNVFIQLHSHTHWYVNNIFYKDLNYYSSLGLQYTLFHIKNVICKNISKLLFICKNTKFLFSLKDYILNKFKKIVNVNFSSLYCIEVMSNKVSKGNALKILLNILGLSLDNCLSFGDSMNDQDMLELSGKGCIMKNGDFFLKRSLFNMEVIGSNLEDGVAKYLTKIFKIN